MNLIDLSKIAPSDGGFVQYLNTVCESMGYDYASYAAINPVSGAVQGFANYRPDWISHYTKKGLHRIDPTIHISRKSIAPVDWQRLERTEQFSTVFSDAPDFGVTDRGLTVPVRGPYGDVGLLSVTRDCNDVEWKNLKKETIGDLQVAAVHMHDNVIASDLSMAALNRPMLSFRERETLQWVADGKSQQDIGDILGISHRTVEVHLRSIRTKLGTLTTAQAIGRAIGLGIITPS